MNPISSEHDAHDLLNGVVNSWGGTPLDYEQESLLFSIAATEGSAWINDSGVVEADVFLAFTAEASRAEAWATTVSTDIDAELNVVVGQDDDGSEIARLMMTISFDPATSRPPADKTEYLRRVRRAWIEADSGQELAVLSDVLTGLDLSVSSVKGSIIEFWLGAMGGEAYVKDSGDRARIHTYIDSRVDKELANAWISRQPRSRSGKLQIVADGGQDVEFLVRFTSERPLAPDLISNGDTYAAEALAFGEAWALRSVAVLPKSIVSAPTGLMDPVTITPANAWLLLGDEASFPTSDELTFANEDAEGQIYEYLWTAAKQTQPGDLLFLYFVRDRKAVHFVARAAVAPWFSSEIHVNANQEIRKTQWWTCITPPVPINPIPFGRLKEAFSGDLVLRGRSGRYVPPEVVAELITMIESSPSDTKLSAVLQSPVGLTDFPKPESTTFEQWRDLASGPLTLELQVENHLVDPLLRLALSGYDEIWAKKRLRVANGIADYAVMHGSKPIAIVEVKVAVRKRRYGGWPESPDFQQVRRYADLFGCPSVLVDSHFIHLIRPFGDAPFRSIERRTATIEMLGVIGSHLTSVVNSQKDR